MRTIRSYSEHLLGTVHERGRKAAFQRHYETTRFHYQKRVSNKCKLRERSSAKQQSFKRTAGCSGQFADALYPRCTRTFTRSKPLVTDAYGRVGLPFKMGTNNLIYVEVEIDGVKVPTYFDTGASHAYLARNFYQLLLENSKSVSHLGLSPPVVKTVQCSNGTAQNVEGRFRT